MYLTAFSTVSFQHTFQNEGFSNSLKPLHAESAILHPDYSPLIPPMRRRRMTPVLKMAVACAMDCLRQADIDQPEAIIVGTSLGCNNSTKNFLDNMASHNKLLSPTSFIISTHNTIAGQISLLLSNTAYNMTHTQNSLSFEHALTDATICLEEGADIILVGAADEMENELYNINARLRNISDLPIACGASFFILSKYPADSGSAMLLDVKCLGLANDTKGMISDFLSINDVNPEDLDLILFSSSHDATYQELEQLFPSKKLINFQKYSGIYFTNSAFALHLGVDLLTEAKKNFQISNSRKALIINNLIQENLGLILMEMT